MDMEALLKKELEFRSAKVFGKSAGGCVSQGRGYMTDIGPLFVKQNHKPGAKEMFLGEFEGLKALEKTKCISVPRPIKVIDLPEGGAALAVGYIKMHPVKSVTAVLGENLAKLHLHNESLRSKGSVDNEDSCADGEDVEMEPGGQVYIDQFGFPVATCCGYLPQDNTWTSDWPTFYIQRRLQKQIDLAVSDSDLVERWMKLLPKLPHFFRGLEIFPSLLHGDLWPGNAAQTEEGEPVIFDPAAVFGHHEFDLSISTIFGNFGAEFHHSYHKLIPQAEGFEIRQQLYQLYHYLNHYNHFGSGYRNSCVVIMDRLSGIALP